MMAFKLKETQEGPIKSPQYRMTSVFRCSVNTSTQMYTSHCLLVSVSVSVSVKAPAVMIFFVENGGNEDFSETRMHSSRMRTVRCSGHRGGGGWCIPACTGQGVCIPACTGHGGVYPSMHWAGGVCLGECLLGGCLPHTPPPCGLNDRRLWKHYLAATTLRTVKMKAMY